MPLTVTASNSIAYHVWQLPEITTPEVADTHSLNTITRTMSDGYRSDIFCDSEDGLRSWKVTAPSLASREVLPNTVTDINGAAVSREAYLRSLVAENKVTGQPFVYQEPRTGINYFVDIAENSLSMKRLKVKIYSTGLTLLQRRLPGVTLP